jgi:predicted enzyme related to lactoylglutathione lyase
MIEGDHAMPTTTSTTLGSILLASSDPDRLRTWYEKAFGVTPRDDGFLELGDVAVLVDRRDDVADRTAEPGRTILNFHVPDARAAVDHLDGLGVSWVAPLEQRDGGLWFAALSDPDGNVIQVIELPPGYRQAPGLAGAKIATRLPAQDLERARRFYSERLGLEPAEERPGGLLYHGAYGSFALFQTTGAPSGDHTQIAFEVTDLDAVLADLRARGTEPEHFDGPGFDSPDGIVEVDGNYPSKRSRGERAFWIRDSEGNLLGIGQPLPLTP